jgi:hypothetical protein
MGLANLGSESETCLGSSVHLVGVFISFEKNFYRLPFTPPSLVRRIGPSRASQKLDATATLLRAMPAPSTPEARNLHREAQVLLEQAAVQQAESLASRIHQQGSTREDGGAQGPEASVHAGGAAERPANPGRTPVREQILHTRGQAQDGRLPPPAGWAL